MARGAPKIAVAHVNFAEQMLARPERRAEISAFDPPALTRGVAVESGPRRNSCSAKQNCIFRVKLGELRTALRSAGGDMGSPSPEMVAVELRLMMPPGDTSRAPSLGLRDHVM